MLTRSCVIAMLVVAIGCHGSDPGFDITRVPESAYASHDGGVHGDAETDAAADAHASIVICIPEVESSDDSKESSSQEMADGYDKCPQKYEGRSFDPHATERHRKKDGESEVCCYRRGKT